jgi:hypothetical protein
MDLTVLTYRTRVFSKWLQKENRSILRNDCPFAVSETYQLRATISTQRDKYLL